MKAPLNITVSVTELPEFIALLRALSEWELSYGEITDYGGGERGMTQLDHGHDEYEARMTVVAALRRLLVPS